MLGDERPEVIDSDEHPARQLTRPPRRGEPHGRQQTAGDPVAHHPLADAAEECCSLRNIDAELCNERCVTQKKGGAGFAVGIAIRDVIHAIALDQRRLLPISSVQNGCYDIRDVALSVPTVVGRAGVCDRMQIELWPKEIQGLRRSGGLLRQTVNTVFERIGKRS